MYHNISYEMPAEDLQAVKDAIATINDKMPFLVVLDAKEPLKLAQVFQRLAVLVKKNNLVQVFMTWT